MTHLDIWWPAWRRREKSGPHALGTRHVLIAVCDHFEPMIGAEHRRAVACVERWQREFPKLSGEFRDAKGHSPKHTFFYPIEHYDPDLVGGLADLCARTGSEVEIQLHHENDTAENMRHTLAQGVERLAGHGLLACDDTGARRYGFIHGESALHHSNPDGRRCGVSEELALLRQAGCYADFTLPSTPHRARSGTINSLFYARDTDQAASQTGERPVVADREIPPDRLDELLVIQGPLALNWKRKKLGILPTLEDSDLSAANPPTEERLRLWLDCKVYVEGRPNWIFVKLHTHGAKPENTDMLLGEPMRAFHQRLAKIAASDPSIRFHYVTAREMVNILHAAERGHSGDPSQFRDFRYRRLPASAPAGTVATAIV